MRATFAVYLAPTVDPTQFATCTVQIEPSVFSVANIKVSLILDSRASEHIVPDRAAFEAYNSDNLYHPLLYTLPITSLMRSRGKRWSTSVFTKAWSL